MGMARVVVTPELLVAMMRFPDGTRIRGAEWLAASEEIVLTLTHDDIRVVETDADALPPIVRPLFQRAAEWNAHGFTFVGWGQD
jgi:hypothetical protein